MFFRGLGGGKEKGGEVSMEGGGRERKRNGDKMGKGKERKHEGKRNKSRYIEKERALYSGILLDRSSPRKEVLDILVSG